MNKNRIRGLRWRASGPMTAEPISIKLTGGRSGGCASKAVEREHAKLWGGVSSMDEMDNKAGS